MNREIFDTTIAAMFSNIEYSSNYLFYAHMIGQCSVKISDVPAPAGVAYNIDHYDLYINPDIFSEYSLEERLFILKHEMMHILYNHVSRKDDRDHTLWNYATDCAINQFDTLGHVPEKCVTPRSMGDYLGKLVPSNESAEYYYSMFEENGGDQQDSDSDGSGSDSQNNQQDPDKPEILDNHDLWEESIGDEELQNDITKKMIEKAQEETLKNNGRVPKQVSEALELFSRKSTVSWKKLLRNTVGNKKTNTRKTIMRQDRRFPKRKDLKGNVKDRTFELLVIADVSASMSECALLETLSEVKHICKMTNSNLNLIQVDTVAYPPEKFTSKTKIIQRKGQGGTLLNPALEMAKENKLGYNAVLVLTDGYLFDSDIQKFIELNKKVIWLIEKDGTMPDVLNTGLMKAVKII